MLLTPYRISSADPSATWVHLRMTGLLYTPWGGFVNHKCGIIGTYLLIIKKNIDNGGGLCYTFPQIEAHRVNSTPPVARLGGRRDRGGKGPMPKWLPWRAVGWQCGEHPLCCRSNAEGYPSTIRTMEFLRGSRVTILFFVYRKEIEL